jgi:hypothetical protein
MFRIPFAPVAFVLAFAFQLTGSSASAATYNVDFSSGANSISGTVTTDGTLGTLALGNILDWNLTAAHAPYSAQFTGPLSGGNSLISAWQGNALSATATDLLFDFGASFAVVGIAKPNGCCAILLYSKDNGANTPAIFLAVGNSPTDGVSVVLPGPEGIVSIATATTPVPGALPLFATGLGVFGLAAWRRKRRLAGA